MDRFFKGILCGLGGVSPGLSGSVMLIIFGLYNKTIEAIGTFFKKPKENFLFLLPLFLGIGIGVLLFGNLVSILLDKYEMITRLTFLGFVLGTIPLFYKKVKSKDFRKNNYLIIIFAFVVGLSLMLFNDSFSQTDKLNIFESVFMGLVLAASTIIPGIDSSVMLSSLGLFEIYIKAIKNLEFAILLPALIGVGIGVLIFSAIINYLIKKHYTITYCIIFGLFLSIVPSVINSSVKLSFNLTTFISIIFMAVGSYISYKFSMISFEK